ncbi:MAG: cytochrome P450 [Crocinitomicaceae bacterium]|nr:cytochrome P450 [Crocinitomicaceae bacterium]
MKLPPQPKGLPISGHFKYFRTDPIQFMLNTADTYEDIALFKLFNKKIYFINHPDYIEHVLQKNYKNYHKSPGYKPIQLLGGMGIFTTDGEEWLRRRKFYQPAFTNSSIQSYTSTVVDNSNIMLGDWDKQANKGQKVNVSMEMTKITMSIISETLFSLRIEFGTELWENTSYALSWLGKRVLKTPFVMPVKWPSKQNRKFHAAIASLDKLVYDIISSKEEKNENPEDLLSRFMNPEDEKLKPFTAKELRDEVMTIFIAGHETSANVLAWAFYKLASLPDIQEKVYQEVSALGDKELKFEDMHDLPYTIQVLSETMRMYPPVWHMGRMNLEEDEIGGYVIPKGSHVRLSPLALHRSKNYWDDPHTFNPDRFETEKAKQQTPFTYIPFGAGPRLCAGRNFAMMEMVLILAKTIRQYKLSYSGPEVEMAPLMTLRSKGDIFLDISQR